MNQQLDPQDWPSIRFEGEALPQSVSGISVLMDRDLSAQARDWAWRFPICKEVWKDGDAEGCIASASEIIDHLHEHRAEVVAEIQERLAPHGFDAQATIDEWLAALTRIQSLAESSGGNCRWIAGAPTQRAEETRRGILAFLDAQQPPEN